MIISLNILKKWTASDASGKCSHSFMAFDNMIHISVIITEELLHSDFMRNYFPLRHALFHFHKSITYYNLRLYKTNNIYTRQTYWIVNFKIINNQVVKCLSCFPHIMLEQRIVYFDIRDHWKQRTQTVFSEIWKNLWGLYVI